MCNFRRNYFAGLAAGLDLGFAAASTVPVFAGFLTLVLAFAAGFVAVLPADLAAGLAAGWAENLLAYFDFNLFALFL